MTFHMIIKTCLGFEKYPTDVTGKSVDVGSVYLHHVFFQGSICGAASAAVLTDELSSLKSSHNFLVVRVLLLLWMETYQVTVYFLSSCRYSAVLPVFVECLLTKWTFLLLSRFRQRQTEAMLLTSMLHQTQL